MAEVMPLVSKGYSNQEIAVVLQVPVKTVETRLTSVYQKLDLTNADSWAPRVKAALFYLERYPINKVHVSTLDIRVHFPRRTQLVLALLAEGWSNNYIASRLSITRKSVERSIALIYETLQFDEKRHSGIRVKVMLWWRHHYA